MRIKHFAGYGCVNATKIKDIKTGENTRRLVVKVWGNHERGIYRNDYYDIYNWLVKRFTKLCSDYRKIYNIGTYFDSIYIGDCDTEICIYTIDYIA
jgi:hypothetical protein